VSWSGDGEALYLVFSGAPAVPRDSWLVADTWTYGAQLFDLGHTPSRIVRYCVRTGAAVSLDTQGLVIRQIAPAPSGDALALVAPTPEEAFRHAWAMYVYTPAEGFRRVGEECFHCGEPSWSPEGVLYFARDSELASSAAPFTDCRSVPAELFSYSAAKNG